MKMRHEWVVSRTVFEKENTMTVFEVNDYVDIAGRTNLTAYGKITAINGKNATVFFKLPRHSKNPTKGTWDTCEDCGWPGFLFISGNTGELVCMRSGCGRGICCHTTIVSDFTRLFLGIIQQSRIVLWSTLPPARTFKKIMSVLQSRRTHFS